MRLNSSVIWQIVLPADIHETGCWTTFNKHLAAISAEHISVFFFWLLIVWIGNASVEETIIILLWNKMNKLNAVGVRIECGNNAHFRKYIRRN